MTDNVVSLDDYRSTCAIECDCCGEKLEAETWEVLNDRHFYFARMPEILGRAYLCDDCCATATVVRPMRRTETTEPFTLKDTEDYMQMRLPVGFYNLRPGDVVKLGFDFGCLGVEWMWVIVETPPLDGRYSGMLNNDPVCGGIPRGYRFDFEPWHVLKVETDRVSPSDSAA